MMPPRALTEKRFPAIFDTDVTGVPSTGRKALPLLEDGAPVILNSSAGSISATPDVNAYPQPMPTDPSRP